MPERLPTYAVQQGSHRFTFPDGSSLQVDHVQRDRVGHLWAEVTAMRGARLLNRARLDLLDLQARERFHRTTTGLEPGIEWQARLLFALEHVSRTLQEAEAGLEPEAALAPPPTDTVEPFPVEALPTPLARLVEETARALPCPPDFPGVLMLPLLGVALGTSRVLEVKPNGREGPRIYAAVVAEPGSKKSPALDLVLTPYRRRQHQLHRTYLAEKTAYQQRLEPYGRELADWQQRRAEGRGSRGGRPHAPQEPALPQVFTTDATLEALAASWNRTPAGWPSSRMSSPAGCWP